MKLWPIAALAVSLLLPVISVQAQPAADKSSIWTLQDENASLSAGKLTDRFYVNGLRLGWTSPTTMVPDVLADLGHTLWGSGQQRIAVDLDQQIYTPSGTTANVPNRF